MKSSLEIINEQEWLEPIGERLQKSVLSTYSALGKRGQALKNFMHGTWLGHPLHPMLTDVPLGAWTVAAVLDTLELSGVRKYNPVSDAALNIGLAGAGAAAVTGITDWSGTTSIERKTGLVHASLNGVATLLYLGSAWLRRKPATRKKGLILAMAGYVVAGAAAYLGGKLVYEKQVGVNHTGIPDGYPLEYTPVLPENELSEDSMKTAMAGKVNVLLVRQAGIIYALADTCTHLGGPLCKGELHEDGTVTCPWHQSRFSLRDGKVLHGPATQPQPVFDVRVLNGQIEVKLKKGWV